MLTCFFVFVFFSRVKRKEFLSLLSLFLFLSLSFIVVVVLEGV